MPRNGSAPVDVGGKASAGAGSLWVQRPWIDLLIGCGGWSAPLLLAAYGLGDRGTARWAALFYGLALVCNYPHYMATIHRAYARRDDRSRHRLFTHDLTGLLLLMAVLAHVRLELLVWLFTAYVMWSPWHYTGQNFGLSMMFLRRAGVDVTPQARQHLHVAFVASYVLLLAAFNAGASRDPLTLSLGLPAPAALAIQIGAAAVFVIAGGLAFRSFLGCAAWRALVPAATLYTTQALWFVVPIAVTWTTGAPAPQTRYSTGILAVMHSAQYLWITQHFAKRDAAHIGWSGWRYWATLVVGGVALFVPGPWLASYLGRVDFTSSMLIVTAVVNIHHFMLDGVVWKLRDRRVARVLVEGARDSELGSRDAATSVRARLWPSAARGVAAIALVALAAVDQWRYVLALGDADRASLEKASVLNPYDSGVHVRLARAAHQSGDQATAEQALRRAIAVNPQNPAPYHALERFLIGADRLEEAYAHCRALLARWPREVDTLVNAGVLAQRLGDAAAAEDWWRRALDVDGSILPVHLYLAELLDARGRVRDALPYYRRYLELVVRQPESERPSSRHVALVVIKFGDALARTNQAGLAASQYELAGRIAGQTDLADVEALARERRAELTDAATPAQ